MYSIKGVTNKKILQTIGENLRIARLNADFTQEGLAELVDIHWKTLGYIESGKRAVSITTFARLVKILKISADSLFEGLESLDKENSNLIIKATRRKRRPSAKFLKLKSKN